MSLLSIILPAYNEEQLIEKTAMTLLHMLKKENINHELVFVNDGSIDSSWTKIEKLSQHNTNIVGVNLSRNFGKESAILAGLATASGDCVVVMDCDLQHPPHTILEMYHLWKEGYEIVEGIKKTRGKESIIHSISAGLFYKIMSKAVKVDMSKASDFKLMDRKVVDTLLALPEHNSFFRALSSWVGYKTIAVEFDVQEREAGESKWSTWSLIKYAIVNIAAFSAAPMQIVTVTGGIVLVFGIILGFQTLIKYFLGQAVEGFTTVILLLLILGSIIMISLGIIGYYISKLYEEVKGRPKYIISKIVR